MGNMRSLCYLWFISVAKKIGISKEIPKPSSCQHLMFVRLDIFSTSIQTVVFIKSEFQRFGLDQANNPQGRCFVWGKTKLLDWNKELSGLKFRQHEPSGKQARLFCYEWPDLQYKILHFSFGLITPLLAFPLKISLLISLLVLCKYSISQLSIYTTTWILKRVNLQGWNCVWELLNV